MARFTIVCETPSVPLLLLSLPFNLKLSFVPSPGGDPPPPGSWSWTLNWDPICHSATGAEILVGSCPRSADDVQRLKTEAGV